MYDKHVLNLQQPIATQVKEPQRVGLLALGPCVAAVVE
jgi:hypothetical protein